MASPNLVKQFLACWLQLGKKIYLQNGTEILSTPNTIIQGNKYSDEFEKIWAMILSENSGDCYLDGTTNTVRELLTSAWEIHPCSRCQMPVALITRGIQPIGCPCSDLENWPNKKLPIPRPPVDSLAKIREINERILGKNN